MVVGDIQGLFGTGRQLWLGDAEGQLIVALKRENMLENEHATKCEHRLTCGLGMDGICTLACPLAVRVRFC